MKNILKKLLIFTTLFSITLAICNTSNAVEENIIIDTNLIQPRTSTDSEINPISVDEPEPISEDVSDDMQIETNDETQDENFYNDNYYYLSPEDLTLNQNIYGDVYILTTGNVTIDSSIYGSLFIMANDITITENSEIISSVYSLSKSLTFNGIIDTNLYSLTTDQFISGESSGIACDLYLVSNNIELAGIINRNVYSNSKSLSIANTAQISGNLNYIADEESSIPENTISGEINYSKNNIEDSQEGNYISSIILGIISYAILIIILFLIFKLLKAKFVKNPNFIKDNLTHCIIFGLLSLILTPILCLLLFFVGSLLLTEIISQTTITLLFILLMIYTILLMISVSTTIIALSQLLAEKCKDKIKASETLVTILFICLLSIIYKLIILVPIAGSVITFASVVIGLGIWINHVLPSKTN